MRISPQQSQTDNNSGLKLYIQRTNQSKLNHDTKISLIANQMSKVKSRNDFFELKLHVKEIKNDLTQDFAMPTMDDASWDDEVFESCEKLPTWKQEIYDDVTSNKLKKWDQQTKPLIHSHHDGTVFSQFFNAQEEDAEPNGLTLQQQTIPEQKAQLERFKNTSEFPRKLKVIKQNVHQPQSKIKTTVTRQNGTLVTAKQQLAASDRLSKRATVECVDVSKQTAKTSKSRPKRSPIKPQKPVVEIKTLPRDQKRFIQQKTSVERLSQPKSKPVPVNKKPPLELNIRERKLKTELKKTLEGLKRIDQEIEKNDRLLEKLKTKVSTSLKQRQI